MPGRHCVLDVPLGILVAIILLGFIGWVGWALGRFVVDLAYMAAGAS